MSSDQHWSRIMANVPPQEWFEMKEIRRRLLVNAVWVPLRQSETVKKNGDYSKIGSFEEVACTGSLAVFKDHREIGNGLGWSDIGLIHTPGPYAFEDGRYKPADVYLHNDREEVGIELILVQSLNSQHRRKWLVNQDLTLALGLIEEGDVWRRVDEGYIDVIRSRRNDEGEVVAIEIRSEFLRDYLCARGLALRVAQYRERWAIVSDASYLEWENDPEMAEKDNERFTARVSAIDTDGGPFGGGVAVMKVWRTDVDKDEDVPVFGQETNENTAFDSYSYERAGLKAYRADGEFWREEWIEPAPSSERVRGDCPIEDLFFSVGAAGERLPSAALNDEDIGRWLWFRPQVIEALLHFRGSGLGWYTRDTGSVKCSPDYETHFGINQSGCVNVYAYDIAKLPEWQQRIWAGYNIVPDGPVSSELLDSQMRAEPADTHAPEEEFADLLDSLNSQFLKLYGTQLFRAHETKAQILASVYRFRALEPAGLLELAKDIARLTADSIDITPLKKIVTPPNGTNWGSLKFLENVIATKSSAVTARATMTPLFGIYELRLGDAHLPSSKLEHAYKLVKIDTSAPPLDQALCLLDQACNALRVAHEILAR